MKMIFGFLFIATLLSVSSFAASTATSMTVPASPVPSATTNKSTATVEAPSRKSYLDDFSANLFTNYHGASLTDLSSPYTLDRTGKVNKTFKSNLDSTFTAAYLFTKDIGLGADVPFLLIPSYGQNFVIGDIGVKAFNRKTISGQGFTLATNFTVQAPTSESSKNRHMTLGLKATPNVRYIVPHSSFVIGAWTEAKAYLGVTSGKTFKLWACPYVGYNITDNFGLNLSYEMEAHHLFGKSALDFTNYQTDLMPGVVWKITPQLMLNPYVQIYTGNKITLENTGLGALLNATLL